MFTSKARLDELLEGPPIAELFAAFGLQTLDPWGIRHLGRGGCITEAFADMHTRLPLAREMPQLG